MQRPRQPVLERLRGAPGRRAGRRSGLQSVLQPAIYAWPPTLPPACQPLQVRESDTDLVIQPMYPICRYSATNSTEMGASPEGIATVSSSEPGLGSGGVQAEQRSHSALRCEDSIRAGTPGAARWRPRSAHALLSRRPYRPLRPPGLQPPPPARRRWRRGRSLASRCSQTGRRTGWRCWCMTARTAFTTTS